MDFDFWQGKSVFLTGHTGFKGGWLALWLEQLGSQIHGYALDPPTQPCLFDVAEVASALSSDTRADLAELDRLREAMGAARPEIVFHLAAQPLVRDSYRDPLGTLNTNVIGTAHVLEAARDIESIKAIVCITTDKVYLNREWEHPYSESDPLGGHDPYSASKAGSEIVAASYRSSFFKAADGPVAKVATARAGNVIGGGDWAKDRLVPDALRSFEEGRPVRLRYPTALRPWQHVLEPLAGYLMLAEALGSDHLDADRAWNFGPDSSGDATVGFVAETLASLWGEAASIELEDQNDHPHEANLLSLDSSLARQELKWEPQWELQEALARTVTWHKAWLDQQDMKAICIEQIRSYQESK